MTRSVRAGLGYKLDGNSVNVLRKKLEYILYCAFYYSKAANPDPKHLSQCSRSMLWITPAITNPPQTSSPDTHDRFVTQHAEAQSNKPLWCEMPRGVFTVASVDNFDMLQSYSAVCCGDQGCSYHGTTIQLVQTSQAIVYPSAFPSTQCHRRSASSGN